MNVEEDVEGEGMMGEELIERLEVVGHIPVYGVDLVADFEQIDGVDEFQRKLGLDLP